MACSPTIPMPMAGRYAALLGSTTSNGSLTLNADGSFNYTPNAGFWGTDSFTYTATDGNATSTPATVTITVYSVPTANAEAYTVIDGSTLTVSAANGVLANDANADGGTLTRGAGQHHRQWQPDAQCRRLLQLYAERRLLGHGQLHLYRDGWPCHLRAGHRDYHRLLRAGCQ